MVYYKHFQQYTCFHIHDTNYNHSHSSSRAKSRFWSRIDTVFCEPNKFLEVCIDRLRHIEEAEAFDDPLCFIIDIGAQSYVGATRAYKLWHPVIPF